MYDDDNHDKRMARNNVIAVVLMTLLLAGYMWYSSWALRQAELNKPPLPPTASQPSEPAQPLPAEAVPEAPAPETGWARLPAPPDAVDPAQEEVVLENAELRLVFTRIGARLKQAYIVLGENGKDSQQLVPPPGANVPETEAVYPLGLEFTDEALGDRANRVRWDVAEQTTDRVVFRLELPGAGEIRKTFAFGQEPHVIEARVAYANREAGPRRFGIDLTPAYYFYWAPDIKTDEVTLMMPKTVVWRAQGENESVNASSIDTAQPTVVPDAEWVAAKSAYFTVAMKPEFEADQAWVSAKSEGHYRFGIAAPTFEVPPGGQSEQAFRLYLGPSHLEQLAAAWPTLPTIQRFYGTSFLGSPMNAFAMFLLKLLNWFHAFIPNYGVAIILLTVLVRLAVFPLTVKQIKSMKRMQLLAPELEELKKKHGEDPQELNRRMMELYRERGVSPLGGCLPLLVQMPVFFALYKMLSTAFELRGADFMLWIDDLSQADRLLYMPFMRQVPFIGQYVEYLNLLPILMAVAMMVSQKIMPMTTPATANAQQMKVIMTIMPLMFSVFCYTLPSGLCLYILVSTVLGIAQQAFTRTINVDPAEAKKRRAPRKRQHFYTAAKARQRRIQKEMKQGKR